MITVVNDRPRIDWRPIGRGRHWWVGRRVQIPAYTDLWMAGARFGEVTALHPGNAYFLSDWISVRLDRTGTVRRFIAIDCKVVTL